MTRNAHETTPFLPRTRTRLAQALALALGVGLAGMATAGTTAAEQEAMESEAARTQQAAWIQQARTAYPNATTHYVANCNNSGGGSLRDTVASASSGDTIDMSAMACSDIALSGALVISQDDLTLVGKGIGPGGLVPGTTIRSTSAHRTISHGGTGLLKLSSLVVRDGTVNTSGQGACINSAGSVELYASTVRDCTAARLAGSSDAAQGGGIRAEGEVSLSFSRVIDSRVAATDGDAEGGGIWAGGWVQISSGSSVSDNLAESETGRMRGAGIYGVNYVDVFDQSRVERNEAKSHNALQKTEGIGIYCARDSILEDAYINDNLATYPPSESQYVGEGVGIYTANGINAKRTELRGNSASVSSGGGIFTGGFLDLRESTVAGNYGTGTGAIYARGNTTIIESTISGNRSRGSATIKLGDAATSQMLIKSSTISGNEVTQHKSTNGAAIALMQDAAITYSTITGNIERTPSDSKYGAGISFGDDVKVQLLNSIVAGNFIEYADGTQKGSDISHTKDRSGGSFLANSDYNLVGWTTIVPPNQVIVGQAPELDRLRDNGGYTLTHMPLPDSPVINAGVPVGGSSPGHDQRGADRPWPGSPAMDIGAVEMTDIDHDRIFWDDFDH